LVWTSWPAIVLMLQPFMLVLLYPWLNGSDHFSTIILLYSLIIKSRNDNLLFQMASNNAKHFKFHYLDMVNSLCQCISNHHRPMFMLAHKFLEFPENIPGSKFLKLPLWFSWVAECFLEAYNVPVSNCSCKNKSLIKIENPLILNSVDYKGKECIKMRTGT
jgi:hypothetical protein